MKITKVNVYLEKTPEGRPGWRPILCRIYTDEGIFGDGEAAIAYGKGASASFSMVKELAPMIIGMDPLKNDVIWEKLYKGIFWGISGGPIIFSGIAAIDMALWDIKGKAYKAPVHELLGGKYRDKLWTYASQLQLGWGPHLKEQPGIEWGVDIQSYRDTAQQAIEEGYSAVKVDFGSVSAERASVLSSLETSSLLKEDLLNVIEERVAVTRETVGPDCAIIMENHCAFDAPGAVQVARRCEKYNIFFFEEGNAPSPVTARYMRDKIDIPLAQGERIFTRMQYMPYFQDQSIQIIQPDIGNCGGITEVKKICDMAYAYDVNVQAHTCASPLSTAVALHLEAAIPNFCIHEHHSNNLHAWNRMLCDVDLQPVNGYFDVPDAPGIGVSFTDYALEKNVDCMVTIGK